MDDFKWISDIPILRVPCVIFLRRDKGVTTQYNGVVHSHLYKEGYKTPTGRRDIINKSEKSGFIIDSGNKKVFTYLSSYNDMWDPLKFNNYNVYYWEDIRQGDYLSREQLVVLKHSGRYRNWFSFSDLIMYDRHQWEFAE